MWPWARIVWVFDRRSAFGYLIEDLLFRLMVSFSVLAYLSVVHIPDFLKLTCSALLRMAWYLHGCVHNRTAEIRPFHLVCFASESFVN